MPPDDWDRIQSVFLSVADAPPHEQAGRLDAECGHDSRLRAEVESLLASDREGVQTISEAIAGEASRLAAGSALHAQAASPEEREGAAGTERLGAYVRQALDVKEATAKPSREGQRVGQWRLIRELGQGGMGTVYLAERADRQYESQAAIKLVRRGLDTDFILHRFRRERQILARLDHPNITRMFDGGSTDDGLPYFVMEYVDGPWITAYALEHKLSIEDRIRLCLPVCAAVAYAHRNFIVHRDLKPGNILIDATGAPKLLDFGVSKLLHSEPAESGDTQEPALMTPDYASPEQILGDPVTVASDVYSLGAVIYRLLTGTRPHRIDQSNPLAIERAICLDPVTPPSVAAAGNAVLARRLKGDLDNIVLRAMQKEPARRYASVDLLAEDLRRYLEHRPVRARADSAGYRMARFIRRNRLSVALGAAAVLAIFAGALVAGRDALVAQRRFQDVRKLATTFVFDVEDAVRPLPGSTRARQLIARTAVDYLSTLSRSSDRDWNLKRDLASAWFRIGLAQSGQDSSDPGDSGSALVSFDNAGKLLDEVRRHDPSDANDAIDRMKVFYETSNVQWATGRYKDAAASAAAGLRVAESETGAGAKSSDAVPYAGLLHLALVRLRQQAGDLDGAEAEAEAGAVLLRRAAQANPENRAAQLGLANLYARLGSLAAARGRSEEALTSYRSGVSALEAFCLRYPADTQARRELMFAYGQVGDTLGDPGFSNRDNSPGAFQAYRKMAEQAQLLYSADPADVRALGDFGIALLRLGVATPPAGPLRKETLEHSRELLYRAAAGNPQNSAIATYVIRVEIELGDYAAAIATGEKTLSGVPEDFSVLERMESAVRLLAEDQARGGRRAAALATLDHSLIWARKADAAAPRTRQTSIAAARAWQTAGSVYAILAYGETGVMADRDRAAARAWYGQALDAWRKLEHDHALVPPLAAEMKTAERALAPGGLDRKGELAR